MAENVLSLIRDLSSKDSPLPSLTTGYTKPSTVFFSHLYHSFFKYSFTTAKIMYTALIVLSVVLVRATHAPDRLWAEQLRGCFAVLVGMMGVLLVPNVVAIVMTKMDKAMSWYATPLAPVALYGPSGLLGLVHLFFAISDVLMQYVRRAAFPVSNRRNQRTIRLYGVAATPVIHCPGRSTDGHRISGAFLSHRLTNFRLDST